MWVVGVAVTTALLQCVSSQYQYQTPTPRVWHVNKYPDPWWYPGECNRVNKSAICDPNAIITREEADKIDNLIESVALETRCPCYDCMSNQRGYVIRVALMEEIEQTTEQGEGIMQRLENTKRFAYFLKQRWKLTGNCNETLLIVYSRVDNVLYTVPGSLAGKLLTNNLIVEISMDVRPYFQEHDTIATGLMEMINLYRQVFKKTYTRKQWSGPTHRPYAPAGGSAAFSQWSPVLIVMSMVTLLLS